MSEQLQRHVFYHLKIGSRHQKVKFGDRHYTGFDEVCRNRLDIICDYKEGIQINNDSYIRVHHRISFNKWLLRLLHFRRRRVCNI